MCITVMLCLNIVHTLQWSFEKTTFTSHFFHINIRVPTFCSNNGAVTITIDELIIINEENLVLSLQASKHINNSPFEIPSSRQESSNYRSILTFDCFTNEFAQFMSA